MTANFTISDYNETTFKQEAQKLLEPLTQCQSLSAVRKQLLASIDLCLLNPLIAEGCDSVDEAVIIRDCARVLSVMVRKRSDELSGFSVAQTLWDLARDIPRPELQNGFFAEMTHLVQGLEGRAGHRETIDTQRDDSLTGRAAAIERSDELDQIFATIDSWMKRYPDGLTKDATARRAARRAHILGVFNATESEWHDWNWQVENVITTREVLNKVVKISSPDLKTASSAVKGGLPFGITPYYASLIDDDPEIGRDRAIRAQVLPPEEYVDEMLEQRGGAGCSLDFMLEGDTSPIDLITRRYPGIAIFKPYNTCPQICVYCQRNWEIDQAMAPEALASDEKIEAACQWLEQHPAVREVLVTGGDPLALPDYDIERILTRIAAIPHVEMIRIGSRVPVTVPMRITARLASFLGSLRLPGEREVTLSTHVQHPYEITPELVAAVARLRSRGIAVYNQLVYTFYTSRRYEAARLRQLLRLCGVDPYYTFAPKGKDETRSYQVPLARILQEQKEEARLLPGTRRTDEAVYNVPGLGKNYLRAFQHRDLISIEPDGSRIYQFHPWEKNIIPREPYVGGDVPILDYLQRLAKGGEDPAEYNSIWYYF